MHMDVRLDPRRVTEIFTDCLFRDDEDTTDHVVAEGIQGKFGFHPGRLEGHRNEIEALLGELPDEFMQSGGGGMTFLNACMDKHGTQWTGLHSVMDQFFVLGLAIGEVEYVWPRHLWGALPGGMPYLLVKVR
jgi:hypothetical protein